VLALGLDVAGGEVEQRAALGRVAIEIGELFPVLALQQHRNGWRLARLETAKAVVGVGEPVAALGVFASLMTSRPVSRCILMTSATAALSLSSKPASPG